jgi:hypothetical protein
MENPAALLKIAVEVKYRKKRTSPPESLLQTGLLCFAGVNWDQSELRNS